MDFSWISDANAWIGLLTLLVLEIVLGVDNVIFISILSGRLPADQRKKAFQLGLTLAVVSRLALLFSISWVLSLKKTLFVVGNMDVSGKELVLLLGGLFLLYKATKEIHAKLEGDDHGHEAKGAATMRSVLIQVLILDVVFSLDSVITAVGMVKQIEVMVIAILIAVGIMLFIAPKIGEFVEKHPTVKMLALAFLILIGVNLIAEGFGQHIEKGYTYFAMGFSVAVEMLNIQMGKKNKERALRLKNTPHVSDIPPAT